MNYETGKPLSVAPEGKNLIPLVPPGMKNPRERELADGKIVSEYGKNLDGSPALRITSNPGQEVKVFLQPDAPELQYVVKSATEVNEIDIFGPSDTAKRRQQPPFVKIEASVGRLEAVNNVSVHAESAKHVYALGSHVEVNGDVAVAGAQFGGNIHSKGAIHEQHKDSESSIKADKELQPSA